MTWRLFLDAIPKINSAFTLTAFSLVILAAFLFAIAKSKNSLFRIIEKKLDAQQTYKILSMVALFAFLFACFVYALGFVSEIGKIINHRSEQTSVIILGKPVDISSETSKIAQAENYYGTFINSNPGFAFSAPDTNVWEKPIWIKSKDDILKYLKISMPKGLIPESPFLKFIERGKILMLFSKRKIALTVDNRTDIVFSSPFADEAKVRYPIAQPIEAITRDQLGIYAINKNDLGVAFKNTTIANLTTMYLTLFKLDPIQFIITKNNSFITADVKFSNAIFQGVRKDCATHKYIRILETKDDFFIIEASYYDADSSLKTQEYIANVITGFQTTKG